jgi:hypothetical protein
MTPPPIPESLTPAKRKRSPLMRVLFLLAVLFGAFLVFRVVQMALYFRNHPMQRDPAAQALTDAEKLIVTTSRGAVHGNTAEAQALAERLSREMKIIRESMFVGGNAESLDMQVITKGEFLVFCQLNQDSCAFLIHVPEMRRYTSSAKDSIAELAYGTAARLLDSAQKIEVKKLAIATRGNMLYDRVIVGDYVFQSKNALSRAQKVASDSVLAPSLNSFFGPRKQDNPKAAP